jgi:hypothetical protein
MTDPVYLKWQREPAPDDVAVLPMSEEFASWLEEHPDATQDQLRAALMAELEASERSSRAELRSAATEQGKQSLREIGVRLEKARRFAARSRSSSRFERTERD